MKKSILAISIAAAFCSVANADLPPAALLSVDQGSKFQTTYAVAGKTGSTTITNDFTQGSWFSMDADSNGTVSTGEVNPIGGLNGVTVDGVTTQAATGSHAGAPGCTFDGSACSVGATPDDPATTTIDETAPGFDFVEAGNIDNPWLFFSNTGMHNTTSPIASIVDDGAGNVQLDFSGWNVTWNSIPSIPMGGDGSLDATNTTIALMTCYTSGSYNAVFPFDLTLGAQTDCTAGAFYILDHKATVPAGDVSGFGGVPYVVHLEGIITDTNLAPTANSATLGSSVVPNGSVRIDALGNATDSDGTIDSASVTQVYADADGRTATIEVCTAASTPNALCQGEGDIIYTDTAGTNTATSDSFTYNLTDNLGKPLAADVIVNIDVVSGNLPPSCGNNAPVKTNINTAIDIDVASNATDPDNSGGIGIDTDTVLTSLPVNGAPGLPNAAGVVTFVPSNGVTGAASFDYVVDDAEGATCAPAGTISIIINDPPVAVDDTANVPRNSAAGVIINVPANDTDSDGTVDEATVTIVSDVSNGTTSVDSVTGIVTYIPNADYLGADSFTYTIMDDFGAVSLTAATVDISVDNSLPTANNDTGAVDVAVAAFVDINVVTNDTDTDGTIDVATVVVTSPPTNGGVTNLGTGVITYTPDSGFTGADQFSYTVNDNDGGTSNVAVVDVNITDSNLIGVLPDDAFLTIRPAQITEIFTTPALGAGSYFSMEVKPGEKTHVSLNGFDQLQLGVPQLGSVPLPGIDDSWLFFGNLGVHQTTTAVTITNDDTGGNVLLDMAGWDVSWNNIPSIPLGTDAHSGGTNGVGVMSCAVDCAIGDTYVMDYFATVPAGDPSGFGSVKYSLHLEGVVSDGALCIGGCLVVPPTVDESAATDENGAVVTVVPGATAASVGNTSGVHLTPTDIGSKDPLLNDDDGQQCIGGCVDFTITGVTGAYVDVVVYLTEAIPSGAIYRKQINGIWNDFDLSQGDLVGSAAAVGGLCTEPAGEFEIGLRAGNQCLFLRIFDGGPNDADGVVDGTVIDPSGILLAGSPNTPAGSSDGCSISKTPVKFIQRADWLIVFGFIAMMGLVSFRRRSENS